MAGSSPATQPLVSLWSAGDQNHNGILHWDPARDPDAAFDRSTVPLAPRIAPVSVNPTARVNQGGVTALVAFNVPTNNYSQGSPVQSTYVPGFWQYLDTLVYWGGSAGSGSILPPSAPVIDAAHRNGVRVLGNVFLAPKVYGGTLAELNAFLAQDAAGRFPVADKMILAARTYGFDGWFINQETDTPDASAAEKMKRWLAYFKAAAPDLHVQWYDAMNRTGRVGWQGALNDNDAQFFATGAPGERGRVSDSMFVDFRWNGRPAVLGESAAKARQLGRSPFELFSGVDFESRNYAIANDVDTVFGHGGDHVSSLGIYRPEYTFNRSPHDDPAKFYAADGLFWVGPAADPGRTETAGPWKGIAHYVPARSVVRGDTFATSFNKGAGHAYFVDGKRLANGGWNDLGLQDVEPTYQWIVRGPGKTLTPSFDHADAYDGGTSLRLAGTIDGPNDVLLYQTELAVHGDTVARLIVKGVRPDVPLRLTLGFGGAKAADVNLDLTPEGPADQWQRAGVELGTYAGRTVTRIGLRVGDGVRAALACDLRVGQLVVTRKGHRPPVAPTWLTAGDAPVVGAGGALPLRLRWNAPATPVYVYRAYRRDADGALAFLGATPNTALFVADATRSATDADRPFDVEVESVGFNGVASSARATLRVHPTAGGR